MKSWTRAIAVSPLFLAAWWTTLASAAPSPDPPVVREQGEASSTPFDLYLGPGFVRSDGSASGESASAAFALRLGAGGALDAAIGEALSSAFDLYLGADFRPGRAAGTSGAPSGTFALWLGRFHEGWARSDGLGLDTRPLDPGVVFAPTNLRAQPDGCTGRVVLSWDDHSPDEDGFVIERKYSGFDPIFYDAVRTTSPNARLFTDTPPFGGTWTYRVRSVRGLARSTYSNEAGAYARSATPVTTLSAGVKVKSAGDRQHLRLHIKPPQGVQSWSDIEKVTIWMDDAANFSSVYRTQVVTSLPASGELLVEMEGEPDRDYWFRVFFRNACGQDYEATAATIGPRKAQLPPVLFVHGIWGEPDVWDAWLPYFEAAGFPSAKAMTFECTGDRWTHWSGEIDRRIEYEFIAGAWKDHETCDIVAHSQGGLASRGYIEGELEGWKRVRALFMLGTPNHGGNFARSRSWIGRVLPNACPFEERGNGAYALRSDSPDLSELNYGDREYRSSEQSCDNDALRSESGVDDRHETRYLAIAGTASDNQCAERHGVFCTVRRARTQEPCSGDGVVVWPSLRLRTLLRAQHGPECSQWLDSDLRHAPYNVGKLSHDNGTNALVGVTQGSASTPFTQSAGVRRFVAEVLASSVTSLPTTCINHAPAGGGGGSWLSARRLDEPTGDPQLIRSIDDTVGTGGAKVHSVVLDRCSRGIAFVGWRENAGTIQLRGPDGTVYSPADTASHSWLTYESDDTLGYAAFAIANPQPGAWALVVSSGTAEPTIWTDSWVVEGGTFELALGASSSPIAGRASQLVGATLASGGIPVAAVLETEIVDPDGTSHTLLLEDRGADGDAVAGDHVYTGRYFPPSLDGEYVVRARAREWPVTATSAERIAETAFSLLHRPRLVVDSLALASAPPLVLAGRLAEIRATIRNTGAASADSALVVVTRPVAGDTLARLVVTIPPGDSANVACLWTPVETGEHVVAVSIETPNQLLDDGSITSAQFAIPVVGSVPVAGDLPEADASPPAELAFAPPFPNPARETCTLRFDLPRAGHARLLVFDVQGRRVAVLADATFAPGRYTRVWDGRDAAGVHASPGVYFASLEAEGRRLTRRIVVLH